MPSDSGSPSTGPWSAILYDGVTARAHSVTVALVGNDIGIEPIDGTERPFGPLVWPVAATYPVPDGRTDRLTISTRSAPDARLIVEHDLPRTRLTNLVGRNAAGSKTHRSAVRWALGLGAAVVVIIAIAGLATRYAAQVFPAGWGGGLADRVLSQITIAYAPCTGTQGLAALDRLATRMAGTLGLPPPRLTVVKWELVNAFALPGGRIVLTSGLIARDDRPEALASVLAHEIGHVARRDPLAHTLRGQLVDVVVTAVFGVSINPGGAAAAAGFLLDNTYSRGQEAGADAVAIEVLNALDIAPGPGADFLDALAARETGIAAVALLNSHPQSKERAAGLRRNGTGSGPGLTPDEWQAVRTACN